jgi:hypothetical protein
MGVLNVQRCIKTFAKWHEKKRKKNQAKDVVSEDLIQIANLNW